MKVDSIEIRGLYRHFDYDIHLGNERVLLLTGLNGYGKTTILRMIDCLAKKDLYFFYVTPFESVKFGLEDGSVISVKSFHPEQGMLNRDEDQRLSPERKLVFSWYEKNKRPIGELVMDESAISLAHSHLSKYGDMDDSREVDYQSMEFYQNAKKSQLPQEIASHQSPSSRQFLMLLGSIKTYLIEAERTVIYRIYPDGGMTDFKEGITRGSLYEIDACNYAFREYLKEQYDGYRKNANVLDERFVDNALEVEEVYSEKEYNEAAARLKTRKVELEKMGLIDYFDLKPFSESNARMLTAYLINQGKKLDYHNDLLEKIRLMERLLASKRFVYKQIEMSREGGIRFQCDGDGYIDLNRLSSGEQNEVIMLYYLIFNVKDSSTLMIDEPETSLHVLWQNEYVSNVEQIAKVKNLDVIISTHSPQIIGNRWDECYDLTEMANSDE